MVRFATLTDGREILLGNYAVLEIELLMRYKIASENTLSLSEEDRADIQKQIDEEVKAMKESLAIVPHRKTQMRMSYAYIMLNKRNGYYKIGLSNKPVYRERTLQAEEPDIHLIYVSKQKYLAENEKFVHDVFVKNRLRGEWFSLTEKQLEEVKGLLP